MMKTYIFACVHNAGRSQMAAAWFNRLADPAKARSLRGAPATADDPKGKPVELVRSIRDQVRSRIEALLDSEGVS